MFRERTESLPRAAGMIPRVRLGIDVGGTFTDFVLVDDEGHVRAWKRLSSRPPQEAVLHGLPEEPLRRVVHGSTVATNALLERRGPRTVLVTTRGFRDLLVIRRQTRPRLYELEPRRRPHVVARGDVIDVAERLGPDGTPIVPLTETEVERVVEEARRSGGECFAICLLHSYRNPAHEVALAAALRRAGLAAVASHEVSPEYREYERASTTAITAFLRPTVSPYLADLAGRLPELRVIHSAAGLLDAAEAAERPASMLLSGPAGGVLGALAVAAAAGVRDIITFDMGGTSTDVALCEGGEPRIRAGAEIDELAVRVPMVDIVTVGAGGGSIAGYDAGGALRVGPESAAADPGPACYGRGEFPTTTDANLVLGRLRPEVPLGGAVPPSAERAAAALSTLGDPEEVAEHVVAVANANMARAVRRVSLERGYDPRAFTLVAFGGAGPLHACELAEEVGMTRVLIPLLPGVLSAFGMLAARESVEAVRAVVQVLEPPSAGSLAATAEALAREARERLARFAARPERVRWFADARYLGQAHELPVEVESPAPEAIAGAFHAAHERQFGFAAPDRPVELVALRARAEAESPPVPLPRMPGQRGPVERRSAAIRFRGASLEAQVVEREALGPGSRVRGPTVVVQRDATTFVPPGWVGEVDDFGNVHLEARG